MALTIFVAVAVMGAVFLAARSRMGLAFTLHMRSMPSAAQV